MDFSRPVSELVRARVSTRSFVHQDLAPDLGAALSEACAGLTSGLLQEPSRFRLVTQVPPEDSRLRVSDYGFIDASRDFLVGAVKRSALAYESYGCLLEQLVLKATDLGLDSCWVGYFHPEFFSEFRAAEDEVFPAVVMVGRGRPTWKGRVIRLAVRAASRRDWSSLFFYPDLKTPLSPASCGPYAEPLELVRLAPSAGNRQPWRVFGDPAGRVFHFYLKPSSPEYLRRHLHDVDIGIALSHFELGAIAQGLRGRWVRDDPGLVLSGSGLDYRLSWSGE